MTEGAPLEAVPLPDRQERRQEVVRQTRASLGALRHVIEAGFPNEPDPAMAEASLRQAIAKRAADYVGTVFEEGQNRGEKVIQFMPDKKGGRAWCAAFATFCLQRAYVQAGIPPERQLFADTERMALLSARALLEKTQQAKAFHKGNPQPGDLAFFRASTRSGYHVALVTAVNGSSFTTAEGNVDADKGPQRREGVGSNTYGTSSKNLVGFASPLAPING